MDASHFSSMKSSASVSRVVSGIPRVGGVVKPRTTIRTVYDPISIDESTLPSEKSSSVDTSDNQHQHLYEQKVPLDDLITVSSLKNRADYHGDHSFQMTPCPTQGYTVSKTTQFSVTGNDAQFTCLEQFLAGCSLSGQASSVNIAGSVQIALCETKSLLLITPGVPGFDNDVDSIAMRIALAQFGLDYEESIILFIAIPDDPTTRRVAQADIRRRLWCFAKILALYSVVDGSGVFLQVPPFLLAAVAQVLGTPTIDLINVRCVKVCLDPNCPRDDTACPQHKAPLCDVKYPCPSCLCPKKHERSCVEENEELTTSSTLEENVEDDHRCTTISHIHAPKNHAKLCRSCVANKH